LDHSTDFSTSIDGIEANMPMHAHGQGYPDINYLIPELVDRIEYRKGPYFAQNGDSSSAGSADIHYKRSLERNIFNLMLIDQCGCACVTGSSVYAGIGPYGEKYITPKPTQPQL
jgi:hypothetical protein